MLAPAQGARKGVCMKRKTISSGLAATLVLVILLSTCLSVGLLPRLRAASIAQASPLPDLDALLNYRYGVHIEDLAGTAAEQVIETLVARPEALQLRMALAEAGYMLALGNAQAMRVTLDNAQGLERVIEVAIVPAAAANRVFLPILMRDYPLSAVSQTPLEWRQEAAPQGSPDDSVAYLVAMVADDGGSFFQVHKTNLDPSLADIPHSSMTVNGTPYFYITTLHVVDGHIRYWHYWWYQANNHPNWYYAYYLHYWDYYIQGGFDWPWWYHWAYGWYYWRFWNYWSAWFPW
jgi:hypothetical protein